MKTVALACTVLLLAVAVVADDPCPVPAEPPAGLARLQFIRVPANELPPAITALLKPAIPAGFEVVTRYGAELGRSRFWIVAYDNTCCAESMADVRHRAAIIEDAPGKRPRLFVVKSPDGQVAEAVVPVAAYRRGRNLVVLSTYFVKDRCVDGQIEKKGDRYLILSSPTSAGSGDILRIPADPGFVEVKNFYKWHPTRYGTTVSLRETNDYSILFYEDENSFIITINHRPVGENRAKAEQALLDTLGIGRADACKLTVSLAVPDSVDPSLPSMNCGLSFCGNGLPLPSGS